ncbi:MAG TPA: copper resistance CopC family protein [Pseudonocardiaceae bacterium]
MRRLLLPIVLAGLAVFGLATPALAHDVLIGSTPASGASVATGPSEVTLNFNAPVQFGANYLTVIGPDGQHWEKTDNATVTGNSVSTSVAPLGPAGLYKVGYRIISADGHPVSGEVSFTLTKAGTGTPPTQSGGVAPAAGSASPATVSGGVPLWAWVLGAVVLLGVGLFFGLRTPRTAARRG